MTPLSTVATAPTASTGGEGSDRGFFGGSGTDSLAGGSGDDSVFVGW